MRKVRSAVELVALAACAACSSGKPVGPPNQGPVASISVTTSGPAAVSIGSALAMTATALDASGRTVTGQSFTWQTSDSLVATVEPSGVVTGVGSGVVSVFASIGAVKGQTAVVVSPTAAQLSCSGVTPLALNVGDVHALTGLERSSLCIGGGGGSEYALIAFNASLDTSTAVQSVTLNATATVATQNAPVPLVLAPRAAGAAVPRDAGFEARLRDMERRELNPLFAAARTWHAGRSLSVSPPNRISAITGVPPTPTVGATISLNGNAFSACGTPQPHRATVVAVSSHAIVAVDSLAPPNGFTAADYQNFAVTFDTLIYPLDTLNYGAPTDIDSNGRVLLFFSPLVNALSPRTATAYVGGFFFSRDLFPLANQGNLAACAGSNVGEMFYLPVLDTASVYNGFFKDRALVTSQVLTTVVHEFQHLINAGRHLYINTTSTRLEESWLDESQSMLAQELLYYHVSGFAPKQKLTYATISAGSNANGSRLSFINAYLIQDLQNLNVFLETPESTTPYSNTENVATLGGGWEVLRYLLDNAAGTQATYTRAIDNGVVTGFANLSNTLSLSLPALATAYQSWAIANYVDGTGLSANPAYSNPSWNFRDVFAHVVGLSGYPLRTRTLLPTAPLAVTLRGGSSSYVRFRVNAGATAQVMPPNGSAAATVVRYVLVRTF